MRPERLRATAAAAVVLLASCGAPDADQPSSSSRDSAAPAAESSATALPDDFPLPPDFVVTETEATRGDAMTGGGVLVRGKSSMGVAEIARFYHERLPEAGFTVQGQPPAAGVVTALVSFQGDEYKDCSIQLGRTDDGTSVLISLPRR